MITRGKYLSYLCSSKGDERKSLKLLESDQLEASGWGKSRPNWDESFIESTETFCLDNVHEAIWKSSELLLICIFLVH
jgi:uncharacterized protein YqcC (DUF446 family)